MNNPSKFLKITTPFLLASSQAKVVNLANQVLGVSASYVFALERLLNLFQEITKLHGSVKANSAKVLVIRCFFSCSNFPHRI